MHARATFRSVHRMLREWNRVRPDRLAEMELEINGRWVRMEVVAGSHVQAQVMPSKQVAALVAGDVMCLHNLKHKVLDTRQAYDARFVTILFLHSETGDERRTTLRADRLVRVALAS